MEPEIIEFPEAKFIHVVRISSVGEDFSKWLYGQTCPFVVGADNPCDWAYIWDYERYISGLPIID
jgi:hypothetical protein